MKKYYYYIVLGYNNHLGEFKTIKYEVKLYHKMDSLEDIEKFEKQIFSKLKNSNNFRLVSFQLLREEDE